MAEPDQSLPPARRIQRDAEIQHIFDQGAFYEGRWIHLLHGEPDNQPTRVAVVCSAKTAPKAVDRNRIKRLMRETFRVNRPDLKEGFPVVLLATREAHGELTRQDLDECFRSLAEVAGLYP